MRARTMSGTASSGWHRRVAFRSCRRHSWLTRVAVSSTACWMSRSVRANAASSPPSPRRCSRTVTCTARTVSRQQRARWRRWRRRGPSPCPRTRAAPRRAAPRSAARRRARGSGGARPPPRQTRCPSHRPAPPPARVRSTSRKCMYVGLRRWDAARTGLRLASRGSDTTGTMAGSSVTGATAGTCAE
jgi:hypothetical protein